MCGIAGIWHRCGDRDVDREILRDMGEALQHRGPDDFGEYHDGCFGAAHTRLSVIDISSAAHQPMISPDRRHCLVFNGEIYNFEELREQYLSNVPLSSRSDTEVLLHLLIRKGTAALPLLKGMFAFAFWDSKDKELLLARDPFGKKPLYYAIVGPTLLFASEPKALLGYPGLCSRLDAKQTAKYFLYEYVPAPASGYAGIWEVPMGHVAHIGQSRMNISQWWKPRFTPKIGISESNAMKKLDELLCQSVERRMVADVPVGVFLSGGLDSTTITWYMQRVGAKNLHSCSVSFAQRSFDESSYVDLAVKRVKTSHHSIAFDIHEFHQTLDEVMELMDVPLADASLLPTYAVSKLARTYMKVVLDGDGGDELFGGYGTFRAAEVSQWLERVPRGAWGQLYRLAQKLSVSHEYFSFDFKLKSFLKGMPYPLPIRNQIWLGSFSDVELHNLLAPQWHKHIRAVFEDIVRLGQGVRNMPTFDAISLMTMLHYMHNSILVKLDRATMFVGLEARTPFLDVDLADFVMKLPVRFKRDKYLLKKLMRGRIPDEIIDRQKKGFAIPLGLWLQGPLYAWACDVLREEKLGEAGVFVPGAVRRLLHEHREGKADHRKKLWTLIIFQLWYERWVRGEIKKLRN